MKQKISALVDGELDRHDADEALESLARDGDALDTWRLYHLIGDAMHESRLLSEGFVARVRERLATEPTVLAPRAVPAGERTRWFALSAAASVAALALVGWLAFAPQRVNERELAPVARVEPPKAPAAAVQPVTVPLPSAANDYLLAHQGYSPRLRLQGIVPYARTASEQAGVEPREARR